MFDKKTKSLTDVLGKTNRIVEETIIKGEIISKADFRLDGTLIGNFTSNGKLVIGPAGNVQGEINCQNADIEGRFEGKINVDDTLNIKATAIIIGDVTVGKLSVEPGAIFNATCIMKPNATQGPKNGNE
jgi:cytoskeletal protein CcmA (bactofilin family)